MRLAVAAALTLLSAACATQPAADTPEQRGQALAERHCGACHAVGRAGASPAPEAPPFRTLSRNYRVNTLEEALAEGISVGHPAMPQFQFSPEATDALVSYLASIQTAADEQ